MVFVFYDSTCISAFRKSAEAAEFPLNAATYKVDTVWATAYQATVTVQNPTNQATSSWGTSFSMPQGYSMSPNFIAGPGVVTVSGQNVTIKNPMGNGVIPAGGATTFQVMIVMPRSGATDTEFQKDTSLQSRSILPTKKRSALSGKPLTPSGPPIPKKQDTSTSSTP